MPQSQLQSTAKNTNCQHAPQLIVILMIAIMLGVVVVIIMITVTSSAPCEERRLANQLNSNTDERLFVMRVIEANDKNENINITVYLAKKDEGLSN